MTKYSIPNPNQWLAISSKPLYTQIYNTSYTADTSWYSTSNTNHGTITLKVVPDIVNGWTVTSDDASTIGIDVVDNTPPRRLAPPLEFNRYINASDLLEEFLRYAGKEGVRAGEVLQLPIDLFLKWLIIRACEEDRQEPNVTLTLPPPKPQPRCLGCGKFMAKDTVVAFHGIVCSTLYFQRQMASGTARLST
jgi:hypothetical protein